MQRPIRIANCSGFYGDRPSAAHEMVTGGSIDVLTGDWLAELTMLILGRMRMKDPALGYARTFVDQMEEVMGECLDRGIRVVSNAGGLNPEGCAARIEEVAAALGCSPTVAVVSGDDLLGRMGDLQAAGALTRFDEPNTPLDVSRALTANAYLGCWGIVEALERGADIVVTGRVTDAALTCGPAAWHHGWRRDDFDQLAGAVVAGHVIECGAQATGGNYSFFDRIDGLGNTRGPVRVGFPWVEVASDGSSVVGKHDGTGGAVTIGTVTSQLLYEIDGPEYRGPDVTARFDTIELSEPSPDRVAISGVRGVPPPSSCKVATNELGGHRNSFAIALTGLDIEAKAAFAERAFWDACPFGPGDFAEVHSEVVRTDMLDPITQDRATAVWRVTLKDADPARVGRAVTDAMIHTALAGIPGMYALGGPPSGGRPFGVYRAGRVPAVLVPATVSIDGATTEVSSVVQGSAEVTVDDRPSPPVPDGPRTRVALGSFVGARSGDKGGDANLGLFVESDPAWHWMDHELTVDALRSLLPETASFPITRHRFPLLRALNFVVHGLLGEGVAASVRPDAQAKALGEWLRAREAEVPVEIVAGTPGGPVSEPA